MNVNQVSVVTNTSLQTNTSRNNMNFDKPAHEQASRPIIYQEKVARESPSIEDLSKAIEDTNRMIEHVRKNLRFSIHDDTNRVMVEVRDIDTDEVIKELPPKEFLDMVAKIREHVGLMIDERI